MITLIIEAVDTSDRQERKRLRNRETEGEKKALIFRESGTRSAWNTWNKKYNRVRFTLRVGFERFDL